MYIMAASAASTSTTTKAMKNDYHDDPLYRNFKICLRTPKTKTLFILCLLIVLRNIGNTRLLPLLLMADQ